MSVSIQYIQEKSLVILSGTNGEIYSNRRAKFQLGQHFPLIEWKDNSCEIPISPEHKENEIRKVIELLDFLKVESSIDAETQVVVKAYLDDQAAFSEFSETARRVWAGDVKPPELKTFTKVIAEQWPERNLYPLQLLAAFHLAFSQNACNFSVPGAGKTSTVLAAFTYLNSLKANNLKYVNKILIVGPLSCFKPWEDEFKACFGRTPRSFRISGETPKTKIDWVLTSLSDDARTIELYITSYQSLSNNLEKVTNLLCRESDKFMVVLDEAHRAKNTDGGLWASSILSIAPFASSRIVLTGTPAPNGYQDLCNLFEFVWPEKGVIGYSAGHLKAMSANPYDLRRNKVAQNISPFFIRISKKDLGLEPPVDLPTTIVEMGPFQRNIYDHIESSYINYFARERNHPLNVFVRSRQIRLMQAATNPMLLSKPIKNNLEGELADGLFIDDSELFYNIENYSSIETPTKYIAAANLIEKVLEGGNKVLVWSYYVDNILGFQDFLLERSIKSKVLYGAIPPSSSDPSTETRESIIADFHKNDCEFFVIIANPYAVGESISLHKACRNAIYLEKNFNAAVFLQSKDRTHRYGMPKGETATYNYLISGQSVEETIERRLDEKISLMMDVIESRDIPLLDLTRQSRDTDQEDILAIIEDYQTRKSV